MLTRRQAVWLAPGAVLLAGAGAATFIGTRHTPRATIGGPFELQDGNGRVVTNRDFGGKWMLVYFGYTHCPDACPTALSDMANAVDLLPEGKRSDVALLFITIDPERDTPAVVKDYVSNFNAPITALSGTPEQIAKAAKEYRVYYAKHKTEDGYDMDHSSIIYVMDPSGEFVTNFTHQNSPEQIAAKLRTLV